MIQLSLLSVTFGRSTIRQQPRILVFVLLVLAVGIKIGWETCRLSLWMDRSSSSQDTFGRDETKQNRNDYELVAGITSNTSLSSSSSSLATTNGGYLSKWLLLSTNQTTTTTIASNNNALPNTKGVLGLLPWEIKSIRDAVNITDSDGSWLKIGTCRTPHDEGIHIHDTCCLGSFSSGGVVIRDWSHQCLKDQATYDRVANIVLRELQRSDHMVDEDCDLCRIVELIHKFDLKFAVTGDSMMTQNVDGLYCELLRRGYQVTRVNTTLVRPESRVGIRQIWTHEISGPIHWKTPVTIQFIFQYRPMLSQMQQLAGNYDVLVMNFGLHWRYYSRGQSYKDAMAQLLDVILRHGNVTLLAHRETSAQHHNNTAGEWGGRTACAPLNVQNHSDVIGWRERDLRNSAQEIGYKVVVADETLSSITLPVSGESELVILPFFNLTASLYYFHPDECSHYCSTPFLWMPIWRSLRLAMDRRWDHRHA